MREGARIANAYKERRNCAQSRFGLNRILGHYGEMSARFAQASQSFGAVFLCKFNVIDVHILGPLVCDFVVGHLERVQKQST